jgi:spermidine synthase
MARTVRTIEAGGERLVLREDGTNTELVLGNVVLLSSAALETEYAFGTLLATLGGARQRVLIGGLGFGATLRGVLEVVPSDAVVVVVEKLEAVAALARGELARFFQSGGRHLLEDPRVRLVRSDVADVLQGERDLDAVLLDVDNGPDWASFRSNARLYAPAGLAVAHAALAPEGILAVWSGYPADRFVAQLRAASFIPSVHELRERGVVRARAYVGRR